MYRIKHFEGHKSWNLARKLPILGIRLVQISELGLAFSNFKQWKHNSTSIVNLLADGFFRFSKREFFEFSELSNNSFSTAKWRTYIGQDLPVPSTKQTYDFRQFMNSNSYKF